MKVAMSDRQSRKRREETLAERIMPSRGWRPRAAFAMGGAAMFGLMTKLTVALAAVGIQAETFQQALFDFSNDPWGTILFAGGLLGLVVLGLGVSFKAIHGPPRELAGIGLVLVVFVIAGGLVASGVAVQSQSATNLPPPPGASLSSYLVTSSLESGCAVNTITSTMTCDVVYNSTSNYWAVDPANQTTFHHPTYIAFNVHSARVDAINSTFGFISQVASISEVTTTGASPTVYSPIVGYVPATGSASGYWLMKWSAGSIASINPPQAAPGTTSGVAPTTVGIAAFGAVSNTLNMTLPGSGGSSAPTSLYSAITVFSSYSETVTVQASTPFTFTLTVIPIGEHA